MERQGKKSHDVTDHLQKEIGSWPRSVTRAPAVSGPAGSPGSSLSVNSLRDISERPRPEWREEMKPGSR